MTDRIEIVCSAGPFHEKHGRTILAVFVRDTLPGLDAWREDKRAKDAARYRKHPLSALGLERSVVVVGDIKPARTTRLRAGKHSRTGRAHVDMRCRGCGLARREPGDKLWPLFDEFTEAGVWRVELSTLIAALARTTRQ